MALLNIVSDNKDLSYVLNKNPANPMIMKSLKKGILIGFFPKIGGEVQGNQYIIYFKDASDNITYKKHEHEQFEYLNSSKYNDARFINDAIQELLHASREKPDAKDVPASHSLAVNLVETDYKTIDIFQRYFPQLEIVSTEVSKNNYRVTFHTKNPMTFQKFIQVVNLFGVFASLNSSAYIYQTDDFVAKYVKMVTSIDPPYFIRYLMKIRMMRSGNRFEKFRNALETSERYQIHMEFGDTHDMRMKWIQDVIGERPTRSIIDIGTGRDARYMKMFVKNMTENLTYYAIERDFDAQERIKMLISRNGWEGKVELFDSLEEFLDYYKNFGTPAKLDIICTEVLEHNTYPQAKAIVNKVVNEVNINKFIITVPNADFNQFYGLDGFRHDDHKWEAVGHDVIELIPDGIDSANVHKVGDRVNDIPVTYGLIIKGNAQRGQQ